MCEKIKRVITSLLERGLEDYDTEELTPLTNSKSLTQHTQNKILKKSYKSILKSSKQKDPNLSVRFNGCGSNKLEVACE